MRRRYFLKGLRPGGDGRREGTGPPPPAARVLRIALRATARRAALAPAASGGPAGQQSGQPRGGCPGRGRGALPSARARWRPAQRGRQERHRPAAGSHHSHASGHLFDYVDRQKNYKDDRRSAAKLSLNQTRDGPMITSLLGALPGAAIGAAAGIAVAATLTRDQTGVTTIGVSPAELTAALILTCLAALLAGILPAHHAGRIHALRALGEQQ